MIRLTADYPVNNQINNYFHNAASLFEYYNNVTYALLIPLKSHLLYGDYLLGKILDFNVYSETLSNFSLVYM